MDLNSKIAQYLQKNSEADINQITSSIKNLNPGYSTDLHNTIFQIGDGISEEQFIQFVSEASGKDAESIRDDASLLFNVLDSDDSTGLLTSDEVSFMSDNGQTIDGFQLWNNALNPNLEQITNNLENLNGTASSDDTTSDFSDYSDFSDGTPFDFESTTDTDSYGASKTSDSKDETEVTKSTSSESSNVGETDETESETAASTSDTTEIDETAETSAASDTSTTSETTAAEDVSADDASVQSAETSNSAVDFSDAATVKSYLEVFMDSDSGIKTYNQAIDFLKDTLGLSDEDAEQMKQTLIFDGLSDKDKQKVQFLVASGLSAQEAMNALSNNDAINIDESILDKEVTAESQNEEKALSDNQVKVFAQQLFDSMDGLGTDDQQFNSILNNKDISSDDWVRIVDYYNNNYGSFINDVDDDFSLMSGKSDIMESISDKLLDAASNGNEDAIKVLCNEIHNGTAGKLGTADEFIAGVMNKADDTVLGKIVDKYSSYNEGSSIFKDIKKDFSFGTEDDYISRLNEAFSKLVSEPTDETVETTEEKLEEEQE